MYFERILADYYGVMSKCFRIQYENYLRGQKNEIARADAPPTRNQKEKLDGRMIRTTAV